MTARDENSGEAERPGAVFDAPDPAQQEAEWQVALKQATQAAQMMGQLPGGIALAVEKIMKPRIDWRAILRRFVQQSATADYSWRMPNRRYIAGGLYLPEIRSESMPAIVVVVDSSASTSDGPSDIQGGTAIDRRGMPARIDHRHHGGCEGAACRSV